MKHAYKRVLSKTCDWLLYMLKAGVHATGPVHAITLLLQITLLKATPKMTFGVVFVLIALYNLVVVRLFSTLSTSRSEDSEHLVYLPLGMVTFA